MLDYRSIVTFYEECFEKHGDGPEGHHWPNLPELIKRYDVMLGLIKEHGDVDVLTVISKPEPDCPSNRVKINIKACSVNHLDIWVRNGIPGLKTPLPLVMGSDASGTVVDGVKIPPYSLVSGNPMKIKNGYYKKIHDST